MTQTQRLEQLVQEYKDSSEHWQRKWDEAMKASVYYCDERDVALAELATALRRVRRWMAMAENLSDQLDEARRSLDTAREALKKAAKDIDAIQSHCDKFENLPDDPEEYQDSLHVWVESLTVSLARASYTRADIAAALAAISAAT